MSPIEVVTGVFELFEGAAFECVYCYYLYVLLNLFAIFFTLL